MIKRNHNQGKVGKLVSLAGTVLTLKTALWDNMSDEQKERLIDSAKQAAGRSKIVAKEAVGNARETFDDTRATVEDRLDDLLAKGRERFAKRDEAPKDDTTL